MAESYEEVRMLKTEALARQYVLIVDRSGSMASQDNNGTRWTSAGAAVVKLVETVFRYDIDHSVPLYLFDHEVTFVGECTNVSQITQVFQQYSPRGTTDLALALSTAMDTYAGTKRPNYDCVPGTTFLVILDGAADNEEEVVRVLQKFADPANGYVANHTQVAVSFIQIGGDTNATRFLTRLDNDLKPLDIVDTKKDDFLYTTGGIDQLLHDAIFD